MNFAQRMQAGYRDTEKLTIGDLQRWIDRQCLALDAELAKVPTDPRERQLHKEAQEEAVAFAGAAVVLRLFREEHLPD